MTLPTPLLRIHVQPDDRSVVIRCQGEVDISVCGRLSDVLERSYAADVSALTIDTAGVSFIDSSGLRCLVETAERCRRRRIALHLMASEPVRRLIELTGAGHLFNDDGSASGTPWEHASAGLEPGGAIGQ